MAVVNNIKEIREQRGIHQNDLAKATGYCTKTIGRIERGESAPSAEFMLRVSKYFNLLVEDIFDLNKKLFHYYFPICQSNCRWSMCNHNNCFFIYQRF